MHSSRTEIILIKTPAEIRARERFVERIDPALLKPKEILGKYIFPEQDEMLCGLCGTKHQHGYLISTDGEAETNIGRDCGVKYFGVQFDEVVATFKAREQLAKRMNAISSFIDDKTSILDDANQLLKRLESALTQIDGIWQELKNTPELTTALQQAIRQGGRIMVRREIDHKTRSLSGIKDRYVLETIATISNVSAFHGGDDVRSKLRVFAIGNLKNLTREKLDLATDKEIADLANKVRDARTAISDAHHYLQDASRLLALNNLALLSKLEPPNGKYNERTKRKLSHFAKLSQTE